jgi:hypothetical protein
MGKAKRRSSGVDHTAHEVEQQELEEVILQDLHALTSEEPRYYLRLAGMARELVGVVVEEQRYETTFCGPRTGDLQMLVLDPIDEFTEDLNERHLLIMRIVAKMLVGLGAHIQTSYQRNRRGP